MTIGGYDLRGRLIHPPNPLPPELAQLAGLFALADAGGATQTIPARSAGSLLLPVPATSPGGAWPITRNADRYAEAIVRLPALGAPAAWSLLMLGTFGGNGIGIVRQGPGGWSYYSANWAVETTLAPWASWSGLVVVISVAYSVSLGQATIRTFAQGGSESVATLAIAPVGGTPAPEAVNTGGNVSNILSVPGMDAVWAANYPADPGAAHRAALYALAGV